MIAKKVLLTMLTVIAIPLCALVLNFWLIYPVIISDPCAYHNVDMPLFIAPFFDITSSTGYHPEPSALNIITTSVVGVVLGIFAAYKYVWRVNDS